MAKQLSRKVTIYVNGKEVTNTISSINSELKKLRNEQAKLTIGTEEYIEKTKEIRKLQGILEDNKKAMQSSAKSMEASLRRFSDVAEIIQSAQSVFQMADATIGNLKDIVADAAELDDVYADVMKTTGLTKKEVLSLNETLKKLDTRTSIQQLNNLAYEAGKLGISSEELVAQFVNASDKINIALGDVLGDGAMVTIGKLADVYSGSTEQLANKNLEGQMLAIGSAINKLGQSSTANEHYLVDFTARLGGVAVQAGLSADQILALAAALDQDMQKVEMAATATQKLIQTVIAKPQQFAEQLGMSVEKFNSLIRTDMYGALLQVLQSFNRKGGFADLSLLFQDLGLDGARAAAVISSLANSIDEVKTAQQIASEELTTGMSVIDEFNVKNNTLQAKQEKARKEFQATRIALGEQLYPVIIKLTKTSTVGIKMMSEVIELFKEDKIALSGVLVILTALTASMIKNQAIKVKDLVVSKALLVVRKAEAIQANINTAREAKQAAAREANTLAAIKQDIAISKKIIADKAEYIAMGHSSIVMTAERNVRLLSEQATKQATIAENAHTVAIKARNTAMKSAPWGLIIAGLTAVAMGIRKVIKESERSQKKSIMKELAKETSTAQAELDTLFKQLKKNATGTHEYKDALDKLKQIHPELIDQFIDEKGKINDLNTAYQSLTASVKQNAYAKFLSEKESDVKARQYEDYYKTMEEVEKKVRKKLPEARADELIEKLNEEALSTLERSSNFNYSKVRKMAEGSGINLNFETFTNDLLKFKNRMREFEKEIEFINSLSPEIKIENKNTSATQKALEDAQRAVKEMSKIVSSGLTTSFDQVEEKTKQAKENLLIAYKVTSADKLPANAKKLYGELDKIEKQSKSNNTQMESAETTVKDTKRALEDVRRVIKELSQKELNGAAKIFSTIENDTAKVKQNLLDAYGVSSPTHLPTEAREEYFALADAEQIAKIAQLKKYTEQSTEELKKLSNELAPKNENDWLNEVTEASNKLVAELDKLDLKIHQLSDSKNAILQQASTLADGDPFKTSLSAIADEIDKLINRYSDLKSLTFSKAYSGIDTSSAITTSKTYSEEAMSITQNDKMSWMLGDDYIATIDEIIKKYQTLTDNVSKAKEAENEIIKALEEKKSKTNNPLEIETIQQEIDKHKEKSKTLETEINNISKLKDEAIKTAKKETLSKTLANWGDLIRQFSEQALDIFSSVNKLLDNIAASEIQHEEEIKDAHLKTLEERHDQGLISQEEYETSKKKIEDDFDKKEKEMLLEQWQRSKALNISQATMSSALAIIQTWADSTLPTAAKIAMSALVAANTAIQIAAIANEPKPYAKGGYVEKETHFIAGEAGREWVASNSLLQDKETSAMIAALDAYQKGNKSIFRNMPFANVNFSGAKRAVLGDRERLLSSNSISKSNSNDEIIGKLSAILKTLEDPKMRRAIISKSTQDDFDNNENFLRNYARL